MKFFSKRSIIFSFARVYEKIKRVGRFAYRVMNSNRPMNIYTAIRLFSSPVLVRKSFDGQTDASMFALRSRGKSAVLLYDFYS